MKTEEINSLFKNLTKVIKNPKTDLSYKNKFTNSKLKKLHFYAFGGIKKTSDWLNSLQKSDIIYKNNQFISNI